MAGYRNGSARGALGAFVQRVLGYDRGLTYAGSVQQRSNQPDTAVESWARRARRREAIH